MAKRSKKKTKKKRVFKKLKKRKKSSKRKKNKKVQSNSDLNIKIKSEWVKRALINKSGYEKNIKNQLRTMKIFGKKKEKE